MNEEAEFFPLNAELHLPYIPLTQCGDVSAIDPIEHPVLYIYERRPRMHQTVVLGYTSYRQLYLKRDPYISCETVALQPVNQLQLVTLPLFRPAPNSDEMSYVNWSKVAAYVNNCKLPLNVSDYHSMYMLNIYDPQRVQDALALYLSNTASGYGTDGLCALCRHNSIEYSLVPTTREDWFRLARKYPNRDVPKQLFQVSALDAPPDVSISNGVALVSYMEFAACLQSVCMRGAMTAHTRYYQLEDRLPMAFDYFKAVCKDADERKRAFANRHLRKQGTVDIEDLGDLIHQMPPCVERMLEERTFPAHIPRLRLTSMFRAAGIALETVRRFYQYLFDLDNDQRHPSLKARFDYEAFYNSPKGYSPNCNKMQEYCPYAEDTRTVKCMQAFTQKFPTKYRQNDESYLRPYKWFEWANRRGTKRSKSILL